ncbi:MAG: carboxylate-amine ligase [Longimicrobiales bacterium]
MLEPPSLTIGIEEEYQIIDPVTRELRSYITEMLKAENLVLREVKPELHQSIVEVGTTVCRTPSEAGAELARLRGIVMDVAAREGLVIAAAGTHPFSSWITQEITPLERYLGVKQDMQELAQQLLIFGTHIHIGVDDREFMIDAMNVARYFLPHLLCLGSSSPFWMGRNTGLKSYRSVLFSNLPRTGIPRPLKSWAEFESLQNTMVRTRSITDGSKIYWDVRPHHTVPTLEFRFLDVCTRIREAICLAALLQAIVLKLWKMRLDNMTFRVYSSELIDENKWRAVRYGLDGMLIDLGKEAELPAPVLIRELVDWFIADVVDELGSRAEIEYAYRILEEGSSADRQLRAFHVRGELRDVVDQLVRETREDVVDDVVNVGPEPVRSA